MLVFAHLLLLYQWKMGINSSQSCTHQRQSNPDSHSYSELLLFREPSDYNILKSVQPKGCWILNINSKAEIPRWKGHFLQVVWSLNGKVLRKRIQLLSHTLHTPTPNCHSHGKKLFPKSFLEALHANLNKLKEIFPLLESKSDSFTA